MRATTCARRSSRQHHGPHRRAARRQLVDHRDVEIGVRGHGERARNGRRGHDQLVRQRGPRLRLSPAACRRCCTPKRCCSSTMTSARRANSMPSWNSACVPTHDAHLARGDGRERAAPRARRLLTRQQRHRDAERARTTAWKLRQCCSASSSVGAMSAACSAAAGRARGGRRGHHGLAAADVALHQPRHRHAAHRGRASTSREHARLRAGELEGQRRRANRAASPARIGERRRRDRSAARACAACSVR